MFASEISTVSESEEEISASKTLDEYFTSECDLAMLFGLTYDQYWFGEPEMFYACAKTYKTKTEQLAQERDTLAWLTGQYVLAALNVMRLAKRVLPKGVILNFRFMCKNIMKWQTVKNKNVTCSVLTITLSLRHNLWVSYKHQSRDNSRLFFFVRSVMYG